MEPSTTTTAQTVLPMYLQHSAYQTNNNSHKNAHKTYITCCWVWKKRWDVAHIYITVAMEASFREKYLKSHHFNRAFSTTRNSSPFLLRIRREMGRCSIHIFAYYPVCAFLDTSAFVSIIVARKMKKILTQFISFFTRPFHPKRIFFFGSSSFPFMFGFVIIFHTFSFVVPYS